MDQASQTSPDRRLEPTPKWWFQWAGSTVTVVILVFMIQFFILHGKVRSLEHSKIKDLEDKVRSAESSSAVHLNEISRLSTETVQTKARITKLEADLEEIRKKLK